MKCMKYAFLFLLLLLPEHLLLCQANELEEAKTLIQKSEELIRLHLYDQALPLCRRELAILEKTFGPAHEALLLPLNDIGVIYLNTSQFALARQTFQRALPIAEANPDFGYLDTILNNFASVYQTEGNYHAADPLQARALNLRLANYGPSSPQYGIALDNMALLKRKEGDYSAAEKFASEAVDVLKAATGDHAEDLAIALNNLASIHDYKSDYAFAEPLHKRAIEILEGLYGDKSPSLIIPLNDLAAMYDDQEDFARAEPLYLRSLAICEANPESNGLKQGTDLSNLGLLYVEMGRLKEAEPLLKKSLELHTAMLGQDNAEVARVHNNLGTLYQMQRDFPKAEQSYQRALVIWRKVLGNNHPDVATVLSNLAAVKEDSGDLDAARGFLRESNAIFDANLRLILSSGSEAAKRAYLEKLRDVTNSSISFYSGYVPHKPEAAGEAAALVLSRKGRLIDAVADEMGILRQHLGPEERKLFDQLIEVRHHIAAILAEAQAAGGFAQFAGEYQEALASEDSIERKIVARSALFKSQDQPVTLSLVQGNLSPGSVLIEYVQYRSYRFPAAPNAVVGKPQYAAYLLSNSGPPVWVNLGRAVSIDEIVEEFRKTLRSPSSADASLNATHAAARAYDALLGPLATYLNDKQHLFIAPDGALNLAPFAALVDHDGRYLRDRYGLTYLPSGRDLVPQNRQALPRTAPLLVANPDYNFADPGISATANSSQSGARQLYFAPLSTREAAAIAKLIPTATLSSGASATKDMLERVRAPAALHIATHGFFLEPEEQKGGGLNSLLRSRATDLHSVLVRSGLALAGANHNTQGSTRGLLTALEASDLDLWGTQLVVLSACDTGLGAVSNGDGVYGLRRAMSLAGARCQVMSLWKVDDYATRDLMTVFYQEVLRGATVANALRSAQVAVAGQPGRGHPYYWASFIAAGDCEQVDLAKMAANNNDETNVARFRSDGVEYAKQGRLSEAESLFQKALAIDEKDLRPDHPDLVKDAHRLGEVYFGEKKYDQAAPLLERAVAVEEKDQEANADDLVLDLGYLGLIYAKQQRLNEGELFLRRAVTASERIFRSSDSRLAIFYQNLSGLYYQEHKYGEAEPFLRKILGILATDDPDRVTALNYLAAVYFHQQKYVDAEPLLKEAAALQEKIKGPADPDLATILGNLAFDLQKQGRAAEAKPYDDRAAKIRASLKNQ
jgi:CHAT domain-containing protein/Flp pilus assembly protein TadD